jgi:uncharacterized damage-inducible protein DinB
MATAGVAQLLYVFDEAFEGPDWHSLLSNLRHLTAEDWLWVPPGGRRTIREIVAHVGSCKLMYDNHAFGDAQLTWEDPRVLGEEALATLPAAAAWLQAGQARLRASIAALDDTTLLHPRRAPWGELKETRWIINTMIQHDLYHAGEINHLRSLRQENDRWAFDESE